MHHSDPRVDAYIAKSADFARPILVHLRQVVHASHPDLEETIKWGMPSFTYKGKLVCGMAAFKQHCAFNLWHADEVLGEGAEGAMGQFGRLTTVEDLPPGKTLGGYLRKAVQLRESGAQPASRRRVPKPEAAVPEDLAAALEDHPGAKTAFEGFAPGQRREYIEWLTEANRAQTRQRRLATAIAWIGEGKTRNWKYSNC